MLPAVFLDKDGTLIENVPYNVDPDRIRLQPGTAEALRRLHDAGYLLIIISNQSGVARGLFQEADLAPVQQRLSKLLSQIPVPLAGFYYCPHHSQGTVAKYALECECRKPRPGMILQAAAEHSVDLARSWFIGDILDDVEAGKRAGCRTILLNNGSETEWRLTPMRWPDWIVPSLPEAALAVTTTGTARKPQAVQQMNR